MNIFKGLLFLIIILISIGSVYYFYPDEKLPEDIQIDAIKVYKLKRQLLVFSDDKLIKTYKIAIGKVAKGPKTHEGDQKTPEGLYFINSKNAQSGYYKNLGVSYPEQKDIKKAKELGKPVGGDIKIHGLRNDLGFIGKFHRWSSTNGCIRVTNEEMDELFNSVKIGTKIEIY